MEVMMILPGFLTPEHNAGRGSSEIKEPIASEIPFFIDTME